MKNRIGWWVLLLCALLTGCNGDQQRRKGVVCQISVTAGEETRVFSSQGDMMGILEGLRNLGQLTTPQIDPDSVAADICRIVILRTDDSSLIYELKTDRYIRRGSEGWREMDPHSFGELMERILDQSFSGARSE